MNFEYWVRPNKLFQADGTGGDPIPPEKPEEEIVEDEEVELDPTSKLYELEMDALDQLLDNDKIDQDKLVEWMKSRNEDDTLDSVFIKEDPDKKDPDKVDPDKKDDAGKLETDPDKETDSEDDPDKKDPDELTDAEKKAAADKIAADKKDADAAETGKKDEADPDKDKTKSKAFKINDEYIDKQVQNFKDRWKDDTPEVLNKKIEAIQDVLNGVKGNEMDAKSLKNYMNAQMYIKSIKSPFDADWKPDQKTVGDPEYIKEATKQKQNMIVDRMKDKFPDFPDDAFDDDDESLKNFEDSMSRREFLEYNKMYVDVIDQIDSEYDRYVHVSQNWEDIAEKTIRTDVAMFQSRLSKMNLTLNDIGIDTLDLNKEDLYNEYLWKNILFSEGDTNRPNEAVLTFMDELIPIVKPMSVYHRLMDLNVDLIVQAREHQARVAGFKAGQNNIEDPSISNMPGKEHRQKVEIDADDFTDETTPEQDQEKLDEIKAGVAKSSGATFNKKR